jgi:hypothetical protein
MAIRMMVLAASMAATASAAQAAGNRFGNGEDVVEGSYLVQASGRTFPADFAATVASLGGTVTFAHNGAGVGAVRGLTVEGAAQLATLRGIATVDADDVTTLARPDVLEIEGTDLGVESPSNPATAFFFPRQWHLRQIEAPAAWAAGRLGESYTKVGILDSGLGYTHADLHYHGTHVGATVASNGLAAAGVTSGLTLVGIKVCDVNGSCPTSSVLQGVLYAADIGLPVANMSLGGNFERREASARGGLAPSFIGIINQVFNYANRKGTTVVVSAGNSNLDLDHDGNGYKAYCSAPSVICVSATGPTASASINGPWTDPDAKASYSNYGVSGISVAAPGGTSSAVVWAACSTFSLQIPVCRTGTFVVGLGGTSMAAPHAAATAALISEETGPNPGMIRTRLQQSADDLGAVGTDPVYGKGRVNVRKAVGL